MNNTSTQPWTIDDMYVNPKTGAVSVIVKFDFGKKTNINFPPSMFSDCSKEEIESIIERHINSVYEERKKAQEPTEKTKIDDAIKELKEKHKKKESA